MAHGFSLILPHGFNDPGEFVWKRSAIDLLLCDFQLNGDVPYFFVISLLYFSHSVSYFQACVGAQCE